MEKSFGFESMEKGDPRILGYVSDKLRLIVRLLDPYNPRNPEEHKGTLPMSLTTTG